MTAARYLMASTAMATLGLVLASTTVTAQEREPDMSGIMDEQIVTGSHVPLQRRQIGSAVTVLDTDFLKDAQLPYAAEALRHVPGVAISRTGGFGGLTQLRLRGAEGNHVLVLIDGVEVAPAGSGEVDLSSLLTADVERIEVLRGPQSGIYGSNAMAGVVQIFTRSNGPSGLTASFEGGSFGTYQATGSGRISGERGFLTLNGAYRESDGFSISPTGTEKDGDENLTLGGQGRLELTDTLRLDASIRYVDKDSDSDDQDFSGGPMQGLVIDSDSYTNTTDLSGHVGGTLSLMDDKWVTNAYGNFTDNKSLGYSGSQYGSKSSRQEFGLTSSYRFETGQIAHTLVGFIDHERESYRNTFPYDPSQIPTQKRELLGIGAEYHIDLMQGLYLSGAVRHDDNDNFENATTYRLSAAYMVDATGSRLHASYGTGVTNPTFTEQFGYSPGQYVGNTALTPEKADSWDLGIEQQLVEDRLIVDVTYFHSTLKDEIVSGFNNDLMLPTSVNDAGRSKRKGIEVSLTARPVEGLQINGAYSYVDSTDPDGTREVRRPTSTASLDISYAFPGDRLTLYLGGIYNGKQLDNDYRNYFINGFMAEKTALGSYTVVNASANYRVTDWLEVFGRVENMTDEDYQEVLGYATPGISGFAGIRVRYNAGR